MRVKENERSYIDWKCIKLAVFTPTTAPTVFFFVLFLNPPVGTCPFALFSAEVSVVAGQLVTA